MKERERKKRRKIKSAEFYLGHMVNSHMTVIVNMMESYKYFMRKHFRAYCNEIKWLAVRSAILVCMHIKSHSRGKSG